MDRRVSEDAQISIGVCFGARFKSPVRRNSEAPRKVRPLSRRAEASACGDVPLVLTSELSRPTTATCTLYWLNGAAAATFLSIKQSCKDIPVAFSQLGCHFKLKCPNVM